MQLAEMTEADRKRAAMILKERERNREENALYFYKPEPKQELFHTANYLRRYVRAGNRWGKSTAGICEDIAWAMGERVWYPKGDPRREVGIPHRPVKICVVVEDWGKAESTFTSMDKGAGQGKLFKFLPKFAFVDIDKNSQGKVEKVYIKSKWGGVSVIHFETIKTFKQNNQATESDDWDALHIDEPCPEEMFVSLARGLVDRKGAAWFLCTPTVHFWINDFFLPPLFAKQRLAKPYIDEVASKWAITGSMMDNTHNTPEAIAQFRADIGEENQDEIDTRIHGVPRSFAGAIYPMFDRERHVYDKTPYGWDSPVDPPKDYTIRVFIDVHPAKAHAVSFFATAPTGQVFLYHEIHAQMLIKNLGFEVESVIRNHKVHDYYIDPLAFVPDPNHGSCWADDFWDMGLPVQPATKERSRGIALTQAFLSTQDASGNQPIFKVYAGCRRFLQEIERYIWDPASTDGKPLKKWDDQMENLYRAVVTGLHFELEVPTTHKLRPLNLRNFPTLPNPATRLEKLHKATLLAKRRKRYGI